MASVRLATGGPTDRPSDRGAATAESSDRPGAARRAGLVIRLRGAFVAAGICGLVAVGAELLDAGFVASVAGQGVIIGAVIGFVAAPRVMATRRPLLVGAGLGVVAMLMGVLVFVGGGLPSAVTTFVERPTVDLAELPGAILGVVVVVFVITLYATVLALPITASIGVVTVAVLRASRRSFAWLALAWTLPAVAVVAWIITGATPPPLS